MSYACDICTKRFNYNSILKLHYRFHTGEKPFQCVFCAKSFSYELHLLVHCQVHQQRGPYICEICNNTFPENSSLEQHFKLHKDERKCIASEKTFPRESDTNSNRVTSTKNKSELFSISDKVFPLLGRAFLEKSNLEEPSKPHNDKKLYEESKKMLLSENGLISDCVTSTQQESESCGLSIKGYTLFEKTFIEKSNLKLPSKLYKIEGKNKARKKVLSNENASTSNRVTSTQPPSKFYNFSNKGLSKNFGSNRPEKFRTETKPYSCHLCDKRFLRKGTLKAHYIVHTKEKPFVCDTCGKGYTRNHTLKLHRRVHTEKAFAC